jgi:putative salt-induced outer membrane protein YdiY
VQFADRAPVLARNSSSVVQLAAPRDGNYRLRFNAALQSKVTKQMSVNLRYEYDYDRSIAESELRADSRLTTSLGYSW